MKSLDFPVIESSTACNSVQWSTAPVANLASLATHNLQVAERRRRSAVRISPSPPAYSSYSYKIFSKLVGNGGQ